MLTILFDAQLPCGIHPLENIYSSANTLNKFIYILMALLSLDYVIALCFETKNQDNMDIIIIQAHGFCK